QTPPGGFTFPAALAWPQPAADIEAFQQVHPQRRGPMRRTAALCLFAGSLALAPTMVGAQQPAAGAGELLAVGEMAPDFELQGATRYGQLAAPVRLSDYRG